MADECRGMRQLKVEVRGKGMDLLPAKKTKRVGKQHHSLLRRQRHGVVGSVTEDDVRGPDGKVDSTKFLTGRTGEGRLYMLDQRGELGWEVQNWRNFLCWVESY